MLSISIKLFAIKISDSFTARWFWFFSLLLHLFLFAPTFDFAEAWKCVANARILKVVVGIECKVYTSNDSAMSSSSGKSRSIYFIIASSVRKSVRQSVQMTKWMIAMEQETIYRDIILSLSIWRMIYQQHNWNGGACNVNSIFTKKKYLQQLLFFMFYCRRFAFVRVFPMEGCFGDWRGVLEISMKL